MIPAGAEIGTVTASAMQDGTDEPDETVIVEIVEVTKAKMKFDEGFKMELGTISGRAELRQVVRFTQPGTHTIKGEIEYQVCDDATCLPPKYEPFSLTVTVGGEVAATETGGVSER